MMKMISKKHTSKFVAGFLQGLGLVACVSFTSCGNKESKDKQTNELVDKLKKKDFYKNLAKDEGSLKKIAEWMEKNGKNENHKFLQSELNEIFSDSNVKFSVDDDGKLVKSQTGDISGIIKPEEKEQVSLKIEGKGKVSILKGEAVEKSFTFDKIDELQEFVKVLKDKKISGVTGNWSLKFDKENVKICEHETGFKVVDVFESLVECFVDLSKVDGFKSSNLVLSVESGVLSLNKVDCSGVEFCKKKEFWNLVKDNTVLFGITNIKFDIEKSVKNSKGGDNNVKPQNNNTAKGNGDGVDNKSVENDKKDSVLVKINDFESSLNWSEVMMNDNDFIKDSGWDKIFQLKGQN